MVAVGVGTVQCGGNQVGRRAGPERTVIVLGDVCMKPKAAQESEGKRNWVRDQVYSVIQQRALGLSMFSCISCGPSYIARNALSLCKSPSLLFSVPLDPGEMTPSLLSHWSPLWGGCGQGSRTSVECLFCVLYFYTRVLGIFHHLVIRSAKTYRGLGCSQAPEQGKDLAGHRLPQPRRLKQEGCPLL